MIGDVHGCHAELVALLRALGYDGRDDAGGRRRAPPEGRRAVFVGDLVDRGPDTPGVLRLVMGMVAGGHRALHPAATTRTSSLRSSRGRNVQVSHGLAETLEQLDAEPEDVPRTVRATSSTDWSATSCSTAASSSSRTPG